MRSLVPFNPDPTWITMGVGVLALAGMASACRTAVPLGGLDSAADSDSLPTIADSQDSPTDDSDSPVDTGECGEIPADEDGYVALFDAGSVHELAITIGDGEMAALAAAPGSYVLADVVVDGTPLSGVGLKMQGNSDQERWDGKPGFKVDLRAFANCEAFASVDHLSLDANSDDPAQARAVISAQVLAGAGLVVPKATFATVSVNGEGFGLYTSVEPVEAAFIGHHFSEDGVLWEAGDGADFTTGAADAWDDIDGAGDPAVISAVSDVVASAGDDFYAQVDILVDMEQLLTEWAGLAAIGHLGAYPYAAKDVYLFAPASDSRLQFIPCDLDEGWDPAFGWNYVESALGLRCAYDTVCAAALQARIMEVLTTVEGLDVPGIASAAFALSDEAMVADTRRGTSTTEVSTARTTLLTSTQVWPAVVRGQLE